MQARCETKFQRVLIGSLALAAIHVGGLHAQVEQGRFVGRISDPQGASVPGVTVQVRNLDTNITQTGVTNGSGEYVITPVPAGNYVLTVNAPGFTTANTKTIEVQVGQIVRQDVGLTIGSATEVVEVNTTAPLLSTDSATSGQVITNQQLTELPLNGRGFYQLASLTPGAALLPPTGNSLAIRPEVVNGNVISGIRGSATSFLLDGVDVSEQHQGGTFIQTSIDALQEFSVQQSPYSAEFNRGGAFFNATTKSGTNRLHGTLFEFIRNDAFDAKRYFLPSTQQKQKLRRNQFGGNLGGPIRIPGLYNGSNRSFFFFNYEGLRLTSGQPFTGTVASDAQRAGVFSRNIYDRTNLINGVPQQFPNNTIPGNRISAAALKIQQYIPRQNTGAGTFSYAGNQTIGFDQFITRLDHQISPGNRLSARWVYVKQREVDPNFAPALGTANLTSWGQDIAASLTSNFGGNMVNELRAHFLPSHVRLTAFLQGTDFNGQFGVGGFGDLLRPDAGGAFPDYVWSGYNSVQGQGFDQRPKSQDRKAFEIADNFTLLHGRNSFKFGALIRYYQWLGYDSRNYAGQFNFNGNASNNATSTSSASANSGDAYADFLLGYPSAVTRSYAADNFGGQGLYRQFFFQDDFRASDRLTLNLGLRYEYSPWLDGYKGQVGTFDPTRAKPIIVSGSGPVPDLTAQFAAPRAYQVFGQYITTSSEAGLPSTITHTDRKQFAPRVGLAFSIDKKTVLRSGFGIFYEPEGTSGRVNLNMLPYLLTETQNQTQNVTPTRTLSNYFLGNPLGSITANPSLNPARIYASMGANYHYSLNIQRQLSDKDVFEIGYVANRGIHLSASNSFNDPTPGPGSIQARRPYTQWSGISFQTQDMNNNYNSLQAKYDHRFSHGFSMLVAYTFSKWMQYAQTPALGGIQGYEYALAATDTPHNVAISGTVQVPVGRGRKFLNHSNGFVNAFVGGWQLQTINILRSGTPYTPVVSGDIANTGVGGQRPDLSGVSTPGYAKTLSSWFDKGRYIVANRVANGTVGGGTRSGNDVFRYGQVRANTLRSDVYRQFDASVFKNFAMPYESTLSFRAEFFNLPNTPSFSAPNATIDAAAGGTITNTSNSSRNLQFALKYNF
ncbi:hypothetical protein Terro_1102 [Terriglobus roseus DSM 18391]|uniref:TonB-dependent transporter Oar-like beta-barrel domain-containing protein n=1 Tax=Terriglobus roseus (strain DSM 18391 / NRRL B-41598 / KBS 63) TaxID=926566 RepID=I3ZDV4_TERRK|nr:hypothetical protein Terro_1102 [Terriglobus roseus DSM 18391]